MMLSWCCSLPFCSDGLAGGVPGFCRRKLAFVPGFCRKRAFLGVFEAEFEQNPRGLAVENLNMNPQKVGDFSVALVTLSWTYR